MLGFWAECETVEHRVKSHVFPVWFRGGHNGLATFAQERGDNDVPAGGMNGACAWTTLEGILFSPPSARSRNIGILS